MQSEGSELATNLFIYWRPQEDGGVSDVRAISLASTISASEVDLYVNWRVSSDVYLQVNYGFFDPHHESFSVDRPRNFVSLGITWLF